MRVTSTSTPRHSCSAYKEGGAARAGGAKATSRESFEYLAHYYKRFEHHDTGKGFDAKNREAQRANAAQLERDMLAVEGRLSSVEMMGLSPEYLVRACDVLIDARWPRAALPLRAHLHPRVRNRRTHLSARADGGGRLMAPPPAAPPGGS